MTPALSEEIEELEHSALMLGFVRGLATAAYIAAQHGHEELSYQLAKLSVYHGAIADLEPDERNAAALVATVDLGKMMERANG
jgi:hypothetical protein